VNNILGRFIFLQFGEHVLIRQIKTQQNFQKANSVQCLPSKIKRQAVLFEDKINDYIIM
jgi:hypothetical protein